MCRNNSSEGEHSAQQVQQPNDSSDHEQNQEENLTDSKDPEKLHSKIWPEDAWREGQTSSWPRRLWQRWTFSYMRPLLSRKDHPILTLDDLFEAPSYLQSRNLSQQFWDFHSSQESPSDNSTSPTLSRTLWQIARPTFIPAGICQLISILCQVTLPLLVRQLLQQVEDHPKQALFQEGLPWACAMGVALIVYGIMNHRQRHLAAQTGMAVRATLLAVIYQRLFQLAPAGRAGLTQGQLTTLVAVDTQKLYDVAQEGHLIWALPLAISLVTIALVVVMGPVTLVGVGVLVINVPLVQRITTSMLRIRSKRVKWTDKRVESTNALLQGIQVTKLNHYEHHYEAILGDTRDQELHYLEREAAVWATTLSVSKLSAAMASAATFAAHTLSGNILTAATSFSVFLLFAALRFPINYAGRLMGKLAQAKSSLKRIDEFLKRAARESKVLPWPDQQKAAMNDSSKEVKPLLVEKGSFSVGSTIHSTTTSPSSSMHSVPSIAEEADITRTNTAFTVSGVNFKVESGETLAIVGPVGSGKSTIINGLLDEVPKGRDTVIQVEGRIALAPQTPFILNATVRDNILFGRSYEAGLYQEVLEACCLKQDLLSLVQGDMTEIGERGVTLSGGQKQRVSLARLAYGRPDIALLDDPLSALDAGTAKRVFQNLFEGRLLSKSACILVTHASHFLNRVDRILVVVDGRARFLGTWTELLSFNESNDKKTLVAIEHLRASVQEEENGDSSNDAALVSSKSMHTAQIDAKKFEEKESLMTAEEREHGLSSFRTWLLWFKHAGGVPFFIILVLLLTADRTAYFGQEYWVAVWTEGAEDSVDAFGINFPPQTDGLSAQYKYLTAYSVILFSALAANLARSEWSVTGGSRAARNVYAAMLKRVLRAPLSYFETTPAGRLLNRFTYDMEIVDFLLTQNMSLFLVATSSYISGAVVIIGIVPWVALILVPTTLFYCFLLFEYRKTGVDLNRLDSMSRSPVQAMVTEAMDGFTVIRIFGSEPVFLDKFFSAVDVNTAAMINFISTQRWLGTRIEMMGAFIVFVPSFLVCCLNDILGLSSGMVGLLVTGSMNFTLALSFLVDFFGDAEASITAIERVDAMAEVPQEAKWETEQNKLRPSWPENGNLVFENVRMRYRPDLPLALNGLSFQCPAAKRIAVCGRTGAGKSSLTVALFRLVEVESGKILLDGVDLSEIGLADVRGRKHGMTIIPQNPFLTGRTVRECLDPLNEASEEVIEKALEAVSLKLLPESLIEEGGSNLSVGERQLLNLASALLSKPKILVLDEATASVDGATDALIQQMLRTRFQDTTLLTIAHRLNTIMDYDRVLVMDAGQVAEYGSPVELFAREDGIFTELVDATGPESAKALKEIASQSAVS